MIHQDRICEAIRAALTGNKAVQVPAGAEIIWSAFSQLSRARTYHAAGPNPITWEAIAAWAALTRTPLELHHLDALMAMDEVWLEVSYAGLHRRSPEGQTVPARSAQALTPALFDLAIG